MEFSSYCAKNTLCFNSIWTINLVLVVINLFHRVYSQSLPGINHQSFRWLIHSNPKWLIHRLDFKELSNMTLCLVQNFEVTSNENYKRFNIKYYLQMRIITFIVLNVKGWRSKPWLIFNGGVYIGIASNTLPHGNLI